MFLFVIFDCCCLLGYLLPLGCFSLLVYLLAFILRLFVY